MQPRSEELAREAEETRLRLAGTLEELRGRLTPGSIIDQAIDTARRSGAAEFTRNLGREARENPLPLVLIGIGIAWLIVVSSKAARTMVAEAAGSVAKAATDIGNVARAAVRGQIDADAGAKRIGEGPQEIAEDMIVGSRRL